MKSRSFKKIAVFLAATLLLSSLQVPVFAETISENASENVDINEGDGDNTDVSGEQTSKERGKFVIASARLNAVLVEGDYQYEVNNDDTATIFKFIGTASGSLEIPSSIAGHKVTKIRESAFRSCSGFSGSLRIPDTVTSIGDYAFYSCSGFDGSLIIGKNVKTIGYQAFYKCSGFTGSLTIPDSVESIGGNAFYDCTGFNGNLKIGSSVKTIGSSAFRGCSGFKGSLTIPDSVTTLSARAFYGCSGFNKDLTIGNGVTAIEGATFYCCSGFKGKLRLGNKIKSIGGNAFRGCTGLTGSIRIPDSVTEIQQYAFYECRGFTDALMIPVSVTRIESFAFSNCFGIRKVVNYSMLTIKLSDLSGYDKKWTDLDSGLETNLLINGIAIREDYIEGAEDPAPTIAELSGIVASMFDSNTAGQIIKIVGPSLEIADQEINVFEKEFKIDISSAFGDKLQIPFEYDANDNSLKILVGYKTGGDKKIIPKGGRPDPNRGIFKDYQEVKSFYKTLKGKNAKTKDLYNDWRKMKSNLKKSPGAVGIDGDVQLFGYADIKLAYDNKNNAWVPSKLNEGGIILVSEGEVSYTAHPFAPPLTIVYLQAKLEGEVEGTLRFYKDGQSFVNMSEGVMTADGELTLSGAVGAGEEAIDLYAKGGIFGSLGVKTDIMPVGRWKEVTAAVGAFVEWCVFNIPGLTGKLSGTGWEWELYPERKLTKNCLEPLLAYHNPSKAAGSQRLRLLRSSGNVVGSSDSIYRFSGIHLTDLGGGKALLTYLDDSVTGEDGKIKLMYRYYNGSSWSEAAIVNDESYVDSDGRVSVIDGTPYIIYQGTTGRINDGDTAQVVINKMALYAARFNGASFDAAVKIGETGKARYSYSVCKLDNTVKAVWAQNENNNIEGDHGDTYIYTSDISSAAVPERYTSISGKNGRAAVTADNGDLKYIYYDGSSKIKRSGGDTDMSAYGKEVYSACFDGDKTYVICDGKLYQVDNVIKDMQVSCNSMCQVHGGYAYYTVQNGFRSELFREKLESDEPAVMITDDNGFVTNFAVIPGAYASQDRIAYGYQTVGEMTDQNPDPYGLCMVKYLNNPVRHTVSVGEIGYDAIDFKPGETNKIYLTIQNTGTEQLNHIKVKASTGGRELYNRVVVNALPGSELKEVTLDIPFPADYASSEVVFSVTADEALDEEAVNRRSFDFSKIDLDVSASNDTGITVSNNSPVTVDDVTVKLYDSYEQDDRLIRSIDVGTMAADEEYSDSITDGDWEQVTMEKTSGFKDMVICVSSSSREYSLGNNSTIVSKKTGTCEHSWTERVVEATSERRGYTLHTCTRCGAEFKSDFTDIVEINNGGNNGKDKTDPKQSDSKNVSLNETSTKTFTVGSDTFTVSWNSFVQYDGRKHNGVGTDASGNPVGAKESGSKACDIKLSVTKNGELVDPSKYKVKVKNNKNASVSIDGITPIQTNPKKLPTFKLKFKGKEYKDANKTVKNESFEFGIIPVKLKQEAVTFDKVKTAKDGSIMIKKIIFKPEGSSGGTVPNALKLKYKKQEEKTDFVTETTSDGSVIVTGRNNYYGSVVYK